MSNIIPLPSLPAPSLRSPEPGQALRACGRWLARLFGCLFGLSAAFAIVVLALGLAYGGAFLWLSPGAAYVGFVPAGVPGLVPFGDLPAQTRWAYAATFVLNTAPVLAVLVDMRGLARAYAKGIAFGLDGVRRLRRVGLCFLLCALAPAIGHGLVLLAGHGVDLGWLHASSLHALVLAAVAVTLAEVASVGHAVEADRDGFV